MAQTVIKEQQGFYGIFDRHDDPNVAWALASEAIAKATGCPAKCIKTFLESRQGRDFAKDVIKHDKGEAALAFGPLGMTQLKNNEAPANDRGCVADASHVS